jgi:hypothetical protein
MTTDSDNKIVEVADDGTEYTIDLGVCETIADSVMTSLFELEESGDVQDFDAVATCFSLFINTFHVLVSAGWMLDELKRELDDHFETHKNSMN